MAKKQPPQLDLATVSRSFATDQQSARRARAIVETIADALVRKYGSLEDAAAALDAVFGDDGRPVSGSLLRAAVRNGERNYFRAEWIVLVLEDPEVRAVLSPPPRSPAEELADLREHMARHASGELERFDRRRGGGR